MSDDGDRKLETRLTHAGRDRELTGGVVNPQVQRASTVLVESADQLYAPGVWTYGRHGTQTHQAAREAMCELEDAHHCAIVSSGLLACSTAILAFAGPGDHILVTDNVYGPTRRFCQRLLKRLGCTAEFFHPDIGADIARLFRPETKVVFLESPGSLTFEISDTPAIAAAARAAGVAVVMDNTWSAGVFHRPLDLGADITVHSTSKYIGGAADLLGGAIFTRNDAMMRAIKDTITDLGLSVSADDAYLVQRGLRSLGARLKRHETAAFEIARWLKQHPGVIDVLHPGLEHSPYHALWKRDFTGASGLFSFVLKPAPRAAVNAFLDALELFGLGFSYGGFESLAIHCDPQFTRPHARTDFGGPVIRLSIGLEDPDDLKADLDKGFAALAAAS
jgi:cystathionine beta-lyase